MYLFVRWNGVGVDLVGDHCLGYLVCILHLVDVELEVGYLHL